MNRPLDPMVVYVTLSFVIWCWTVLFSFIAGMAWQRWKHLIGW